MSARFWIAIAGILLALLVLAGGTVATLLLLRRAPVAPAVIAYEPEQQREVPPTATIVISFNTAMDRASVERAFQLQPAVDGRFEWSGDTVRFAPSRPLARNTTYTVTLGTTARSAAALPLREPFSAEFTTAGDLVPVAFFPFDGALDVPLDAAITVAFNRPVVALGASSTPDPLVITPSLLGTGRWISPSVYRFQSRDGFRPASVYTVTLRRDVEDVTGGRLASDVRSTFSTIRPALAEFTPTANSRFVPTTQELTLVFNQPMDRASVEAAFRLTGPTDQPVAGTFRWESDRRVAFVPAQPLAADVTYAAQLAAGLRGSDGPLPSPEPFRWTFQTVGPPRLVASTPADGATAAPTTQLSLTFNQPMDPASVAANLTIVPAPTQVFSSWTESNTRLTFFFRLQPSTAYSVVVGPDARDRLGRAIGTPQRIAFTTATTPPRLTFLSTAETTTVLAGTPLLGALEAVNVPSATLRLYRLDQRTYLDLASSRPGGNNPAAPPGQLAGEWTVDTRGELNATRVVTQTLTVGGQPLGPGFYFLTAEGAGVRDSQLLAVSRRALTVKLGANEALLWATDPATAQPVANAPVQAFFGPTQPLPMPQPVRTGADGVARFPLPGGPPPNLWVLLDEPDGPSVVSASWSDGIEPWQFGIEGELPLSPYRAAIFTDRPVYRAGQIVYFKGIVRRDDDGAYSLPTALSSFQLAVTDPTGRSVLSQTVILDDFGTFSGQIPLSENAATGDWSITLRDPATDFSAWAGFQVAEYRRPEFQVEVRPQEEQVVAHQTVSVTVAAEYFFGAPVAGGRVTWRVASDPYIFRGPTGTDWTGFTYGVVDLRPPPVGSGPEALASGLGTLDRQGRVDIAFRADLDRFQGSRLLTVEASVSDESAQQISGRAEIIAHKGAFYIGVRSPTRLVRSGETATWDIATVGIDVRPRPSVPLTLDLAARRYYSVQERTPEGDLVWVTTFEDTPVPGAARTLTTDRNGRAQAAFTPPRPGLYRIQATGRDELGNEVRTVAFLWVAGTEFVNWGLESNDRMDLVLDKPVYAPGETAKLLVPTPFATSTALLTIERQGVRSSRVVTLTSSSPVLDIPVEPDYLPNVFVSVVAFAGDSAQGPPSYKLGYANLRVDASAKLLTLEIRSDKARYQPGETVRYRVKATDAAGRPVQAQLSAAVVDRAVLSLADDEPPTWLFDRFYRERGLGVVTAATLAASQTRLDIASRAAGKGGGGAIREVRSRFADTAFWSPRLVTDRNGEATFDVMLPDNLTTWRLTVKAVTRDSQFGQATHDIVSTKDLLVRPVVPRFLTSGDRATVGAIVQNLTDRPLEVTATLEVSNLASPAGGFAAPRLSVPARGTASARWEVSAGQPGEARLRFRADTGGTSPPGDAVEIALPVNPLATAEVVASSGQVAAQVVETVRVPSPVNPNLGELTVELAPSLTAGLETGFRELSAFPWEPTEVTVSRLLSSLDYLRVLSATGTLTPELVSRIADQNIAALQRLALAQRTDGGWGWFRGDPSQPFLTAYAVFGLIRAQKAGYAVDESSLARGLDAVTQQLQRPVDVGSPDDANARAYALFVLAEAGRPSTGALNALFERRAALADWAKASLLLAIFRANGDRGDARTATLLNELVGTATWSATGVHWNDPGDRRRLGGTSRSTAVVLQALLAADPQSPLIDPAVRWLMIERRDGWWGTTFDTAAALNALAVYAVRSALPSPDYRYRVSLNGRALASGRVTQDTPGARTLVVPVRDLLLDAPNRLVLEREASGLPSAAGRLYYTASLRTFRLGEQAEPRAEGIAITREYLPADPTSTSPIRSARVGDLIRVQLTIIAPSDLDYVVVDDPLFAGAEAVNPDLATASIFERGGGRSAWRFSHIDIRDDRVALFARALPRGTYQFSYLVRVTTAGDFVVPPARASLMYFPEVWGRSGSARFEVRE
ncbi:MAG: Ig-like domain-containing protein [Chloroflexota bacterium]|nr:Ig-like domain-containing protein [Dehalococcoidia bacterium]MDW8253126.1 Ig-like domain-containing protein [Chloroflexota bacterium]